MPTQKQLDEARRLWQEIDRKVIAPKPDDEIAAAAASDPDSAAPTKVELEQFELVLPAKARRDRKHAAE